AVGQIHSTGQFIHSSFLGANWSRFLMARTDDEIILRHLHINLLRLETWQLNADLALLLLLLNFHRGHVREPGLLKCRGRPREKPLKHGILLSGEYPPPPKGLPGGMCKRPRRNSLAHPPRHQSVPGLARTDTTRRGNQSSLPPPF